MRGLLLWILENDYAGAIQQYDEALAFASRSGDRDLAAMSLHDKGHALCLLGDVGAGMPLLDECMATVVGGELDPAAAGYVYCGMIGICSKLGDYDRASEWTEATLRWCERRSVPAFPGVCRIHRAELRCSTATCSRRRRMRAPRVRSSLATTSCRAKDPRTTASVRCGATPVTSPRPMRRTRGPKRSGDHPRPGDGFREGEANDKDATRTVETDGSARAGAWPRRRVEILRGSIGEILPRFVPARRTREEV